MYVITTVILAFAVIYLLFNKLSSKPHYDGQIVVSIKEDGVKLFLLELAVEPEVLESKEAVIFKMTKGEPLVEEEV